MASNHAVEVLYAAAHTHRQEEAIQLVAAKDKTCQSSQISMRDPGGGGGGHEGEAHHPLHEGAATASGAAKSSAALASARMTPASDLKLSSCFLAVGKSWSGKGGSGTTPNTSTSWKPDCKTMPWLLKGLPDNT
ncbi:MAG: hypothetical protein FRX49_04194 [Trebouxia sp. A1-2]|nr:MAG: hypothetical protein FRX49_04194 [Trebouxia sp. A1-2]